MDLAFMSYVLLFLLSTPAAIQRALVALFVFFRILNCLASFLRPAAG